MKFTALLLFFCSTLAAQTEGDPRQAAQPRVATHYFYWYRWPDMHFDQPGAPGHEGHRRHLPEPESVSYESAATLAALRDLRAEGVIEAGAKVLLLMTASHFIPLGQG